jgi:hypothetical protein
MSVAGAIVLAERCADRSLLAAKARYGKEFAQLVAAYFTEPRDAFADDEPVKASACLQAALLAPGQGSWGDDQVPRWSLALLDAHRRGKDDARPLADAGLAMLGADALAEHGVAPSPDPRRAAAAKALVPLVANDDVMQSWCGARIAMRLRTATPELVDALAGTLVAKRTAPESWRHIARDTRTQPWLKIRCDRIAAVEALAALGPSAAAAAPRLAEIAADPVVDSDWSDRDPEELVTRSVRALVHLGREADIAAILDRHQPSALFAARRTAESGCPAGVVLPVLAAEAAKPGAHLDAFRGLAALGPSAATALPVLKTRFRQETDEWRKEEIAAAIVAVSPSDAEAIDFLASLVKGKDLSVSDNASGWVYGAWDVLCRAAPTPTVLRVLTDDVNGAKHALGGQETVEALGRAGPLAKDAVPALIGSLGPLTAADSSNWVTPVARRNLAIALGRIGPDAAKAVPALTAWRDTGDETIRVVAAQAVRRIRKR